MSQWSLSAPGKMMIAGEYAVLEGHEALVCAVSRRLRLQSISGSHEESSAPAEALAAAREAQVALGVGQGLQLQVDASELRRGESKLGLGSSAAAAAAAAAAVYVSQGRSLDDAEVLNQVFRAADRGHRSIAPRGSGADVCAAVYGGWRRFLRRESESLSEALASPKSIHIRVVWTGHPARTSDFLTKVQALASRDPSSYRQNIGDIATAARSMIGALENQDTDGLLEAVRSHHRSMAALGEASGAPIVEANLRQIAELAESVGGAAKPSGAGGGDVALGFFRTEDEAATFIATCADRGFQEVALELGACAVRLDPSL